jgi:hypothetical protein
LRTTGKDSFEHPGNHRFRVLIGEHLDEYLKAPSRQGKSKIVAKIYDHIQCSARKPSNGFVRKNMLSRRWYMVDKREAKEKVAQGNNDFKVARMAISLCRHLTSSRIIVRLQRLEMQER